MTHVCTLKDIALKCGVSPAIVSTVLNNREGQMKCSRAKRELILRTAKEMEYHPNILARSIRKKRVPIVGVFLRQSASLPHVLGRSMSARLGAITTALNEVLYEVLFVPYTDAEEQYARMKSLMAQGLLGGVITNIDFRDNASVCELLRNSGLPYLVLGLPAVPGTVCAYSDIRALESLCFRLAARQGCTQCVSVEPGENAPLIFRRLPAPSGHIWAAPACGPESFAGELAHTLFVVMGAVLLEKLRGQGIFPEHYVCVDPEEDLDKLAGSHDTFFLREPRLMEQYLRTTFIKWLTDDTPPEHPSAALVTPEENFIFVKRRQ